MCGRGLFGRQFKQGNVPPLWRKSTGRPAAGVEAAIRNAVASAWENGNDTYIRKICGAAKRDRVPTNSLIIAKISEEAKS